MVRVALPILPVAVSGGLVWAHAGLRAIIRLAQSRKYFIGCLLVFINATVHLAWEIRKRVPSGFHRIYIVGWDFVEGAYGET